MLANGLSINVRQESAATRDFNTPDKSHVEAHAPDGKLLGILATVRGRSFGQVDDGTLNYYLGPWYDSSPSIDAEGRTIVIANGRDPEVRVLDDEMRLRLIIRWDDPGGRVASADIEAAREAERRRALEDGEIGQFEEANLSPKRPAADVFPAVSSVMAGVDGTVWVWRYRRPGAAARSRLMAFGPDGEFVCHLATGKSDFTVREFGRLCARGHTTDSACSTWRWYEWGPGRPGVVRNTTQQQHDSRERSRRPARYGRHPGSAQTRALRSNRGCVQITGYPLRHLRRIEPPSQQVPQVELRVVDAVRLRRVHVPEILAQVPAET